MLQFADPRYLYLLALLPLLLLGYVALCYRLRRKEHALADEALYARMAPRRSAVRRHLRFALALLAFALLVVALARPQYGTKTTSQTKNSIEVAFMLDVSNSMRAQDVNPDRLQRAKYLLLSLIDALPQDRIAIGIFAGEAYPQMPMTSDHAAARMFIEMISTNMLTSQGTDLSAAISLADHSFSERDGVGRAIIIITDAEDHEGGALEAAKEAAKHGRKIYVLGIGSPEGAHIPTPAGDMTDEEGLPVVTRLNEELARQVADAAKGMYLHVDNSNAARQVLMDELSQLQRESVSETYTERNEQFHIFAWMALALLLLDFFIFDERSRLLDRFHLFNQETHTRK